jgi:hypothetical protein
MGQAVKGEILRLEEGSGWLKGTKRNEVYCPQKSPIAGFPAKERPLFFAPISYLRNCANMASSSHPVPVDL